MPVSEPFPSFRRLLGPPADEDVLDRFREADVSGWSLFGGGKVALREVLSRADAPGSDVVLLPAYVPAGVVRSVEAAGCRPRFYRLQPDLSPNLDDVEAMLDGAVMALVAVHYFGFPTADVDALEQVCEGSGCYLLVDNAHSPLSRTGTRPLGTGGDAGFASLHKQFPVPDGAVLTVSNPDLLADGDPVAGTSPGTDPRATDGQGGQDVGDDPRTAVPNPIPGTGGRLAVSGRYTVSDVAFCAESMARSIAITASRRLQRLAVGGRRTGRREGRRDAGSAEGGDAGSAEGGTEGSGGAGDGGSHRYPWGMRRPARTKASKLSLRVVERVDPEGVVRARRRNYRFWLDVTTHGIEGLDAGEGAAARMADAGMSGEPVVDGGTPGVTAHGTPAVPPFRALPDGVCPQVFPLVVEDPDVLARSVGTGDRISTWPPLPPTVADADGFPTANYLANHLVRLPVHQGVGPRDLVPVARRVREYATGG